MTSPMLQSVAPVLRLNTRTMKPTISLFEDMGFSVDTLLGEPPRFAMMKRDDLTVMLECRILIPWRQSGWAVYFWVNEVEELQHEFARADIKDVTALVEKRYECIEFKVRLPDGRSIVFGERLSPKQCIGQ